MVDRDLDLALSPELVLVSPELRERALLNDRDTQPRWHVAPPAELPTPPEELPTPPEELPAPPRAGAPLLDRRRTFRRNAAMALSACVAFGGGVAVDRLALPAPTVRIVAPVRPTTMQRTTAPTRPENPPSRGVKGAVREIEQPNATTRQRTPAPRAATGQPAVPSRERRTPPMAATPSTVRPKPPAARADTAKPAPKTVRAIPNGGYVLPDGHFRVTGDARTIVDFTLNSRCAGSLALPPIRVGATGAFAFAGHPTGSPPATVVQITGRFLSSQEAWGTTQVSHGGCRDATTNFVAHLS